ncbi:MAG: M24 family metallopeptidase [Desulfitobacteriaceae bacterium]
MQIANEVRYARTVKIMEREGIDLLIATTPENVFYSTGYMSIGHQILRGTQVYAVASRGHGVALIAGRADLPSVVETGIDPERVFCYGNFVIKTSNGWADLTGMMARLNAADPTPLAALTKACSAMGNATRIALDEGGVNPAQWHEISSALRTAEVVPGGDLFKEIRRIKDPGELALLQRAAEIADEGVQEVCKNFRMNMTEIDLAVIYERYLVSQGASPFFTVISSGERAAYADTPLSMRRINNGDIVRFDVGCVYRGYRSDIARTATVGIPSDKVRRFYNAILAGEKAAIAAVKPGVSAAELFKVAVATVRATGILDYERHHCGHAIGMEVYEPPTIAPTVTQALEEGMVFCLETPYYELGWGGIQVEDTLVVTADGCRLFTESPEEPFCLGVKA